jgi:ERF superfamily protein
MSAVEITTTAPANSIVPHKVRAPRRAAAPAAVGPLDIVNAALATGNVEMYREAVALMKEMDAFAARKAFNNALADCRAKLPLIRKNAHVHYERKNGAPDTDYWHEDLAEVVDTVTPILSEFGLSHRWKLNGKPGEPVTVTCVISHRDGHQEENTLSAGADTSDGKNPIQGIKSAVSYLERITLMASLGLASRKDDDDGRSTYTTTASEVYTAPTGSISPAQVEELRLALQQKGVSEKAFVQWTGAKRIEDIRAEKFDVCKRAIAKHNTGTQQ